MAKKKRCTTPSDNLTAAQRRKLNGPVTTVKMNEPMTWDEFKNLPPDLRKEYLEGIMKTYRVSQALIAEMFGISLSQFYRTVAPLRLKKYTPSRMTESKAKKRQAMWEAFCNGVVGGKPADPAAPAGEGEPEQEPTPEPDPIPDLCPNEAEAPPEPEPSVPAEPPAEPEQERQAGKTANLHLCFEGFPSTQQLEMLYRLIGTSQVRVTLDIEAL